MTGVQMPPRALNRRTKRSEYVPEREQMRNDMYITAPVQKNRKGGTSPGKSHQ